MPNPKITKDTLRAMAAAAGLELGDDKLDELLPQITQAVESLGGVESLDLTGIEPAVSFRVDAREGGGNGE